MKFWEVTFDAAFPPRLLCGDSMEEVVLGLVRRHNRDCRMAFNCGSVEVLIREYEVDSEWTKFIVSCAIGPNYEVSYA